MSDQALPPKRSSGAAHVLLMILIWYVILVPGCNTVVDTFQGQQVGGYVFNPLTSINNVKEVFSSGVGAFKGDPKNSVDVGALQEESKKKDETIKEQAETIKKKDEALASSAKALEEEKSSFGWWSAIIGIIVGLVVYFGIRSGWGRWKGWTHNLKNIDEAVTDGVLFLKSCKEAEEGIINTVLHLNNVAKQQAGLSVAVELDPTIFLFTANMRRTQMDMLASFKQEFTSKVEQIDIKKLEPELKTHIRKIEEFEEWYERVWPKLKEHFLGHSKNKTKVKRAVLGFESRITKKQTMSDIFTAYQIIIEERK